MGSLLCGPESVIRGAREHRQRLGGNMRQAGIIAAAGIVALETGVERLADDHARAHRIATGLAEVFPGSVDPAAVRTNIVCARGGRVAPGLPVRARRARHPRGRSTPPPCGCAPTAMWTTRTWNVRSTRSAPSPEGPRREEPHGPRPHHRLLDRHRSGHREPARAGGARGHRDRAPAETLDELPVAARLALDVTDPASVAAAVAAAGPLDVLVNNVGWSIVGPVEMVPLDRVREMFEVNFFGAAQMIQAVAPAMRTREHGVIVNVSSIAGGWGSRSAATTARASTRARGAVRGPEVRARALGRAGRDRRARVHRDEHARERDLGRERRPAVRRAPRHVGGRPGAVGRGRPLGPGARGHRDRRRGSKTP